MVNDRGNDTDEAGALRAKLADLSARQQGAKIELPIALLVEMKAPYNPRKIEPKALERLRTSLREFGAAEPVVVNQRTGHLVGGHQRVEAARLEGWETLPVSVVDLSLEREMALNVALNNPNLQGRFVEDELAALVQMLQADEDALRLTGLADREIARLTQIVTTGESNPDAIPEGGVEARCQPGYLWVMGKHRLICGDSTDPATLRRLFGKNQPLLCVTDPPYGVEYDPKWREDRLGTTVARAGKVENDDRADWSDVWKLCGCDVIYAWCAAGDLQIDAGEALRRSGYEIRASIIWRKTNFPISRGHYTFVHEPAWFAVKNGATAHWIGQNNAASVWDVGLDPNVPGGHSTQKPVALFRQAIANHQGDVFEPFAGSGTCVIACEQLDRRCFAIEISPHYCDVVLARWEAFTGLRAERVVSAEGET